MNISFFTTEASRHAVFVDRIFEGLSVLSVLIVVMVFGLVFVFSIQFRRGSKAKRGPLPKFITNEFEVGWFTATLFLFLFIFWWAATTQLSALLPPRHALQIHVVAKQWMWKIQQPNGLREIDEMHVPADRQILLSMTSEDVIHSLFVPALRIKQDVLPDRTTYLWFTATKTGDYGLLCTQFCGTGHSSMTGTVVIMKPQDYARWLSGEPQTVGTGLAEQGDVLFHSLGCSGCHATQSSVHAPDLHGVYNHEVHLSDGRTVLADEAYIRDSILQPKRDVVAGFAPIMPSFKGIVTDSELVKLIAYIKSLAVKNEAAQ